MATLVHLADERMAASIQKNGIKVGKHRSGIYCMPVLPNFYVSHQWLRELKRSGANLMVGVYFKVDSETNVYAGNYNTDHKLMKLGDAIKEVMAMTDPLGYEIIIDRKISVKEIEKIKTLPHNIGWRYKPRSNGTKPCACDYCIKGTVKANRIRVKFEPKEKSLSYVQILEKLQGEQDIYEIETLLQAIRSKKRRSDPTELLFLLDKNVTSIDQELAITLKKFKHKAVRSILITLLSKEDADTKEFAAESLMELYGSEVYGFLESYKDEAIQIALKNWSGVI